MLGVDVRRRIDGVHEWPLVHELVDENYVTLLASVTDEGDEVTVTDPGEDGDLIWAGRGSPKFPTFLLQTTRLNKYHLAHHHTAARSSIGVGTYWMTCSLTHPMAKFWLVASWCDDYISQTWDIVVKSWAWDRMMVLIFRKMGRLVENLEKKDLHSLKDVSYCILELSSSSNSEWGTIVVTKWWCA